MSEQETQTPEATPEQAAAANEAAARLLAEQEQKRQAAAQEFLAGEVHRGDDQPPPAASYVVEEWPENSRQHMGQPNPQGTEQVAQFQQAMQQTVDNQPRDPTDASNATKPKDAPRRSREEIAAMREAERQQGVDYWLPITQEWVKVRDLPFTDWVMISGIPAQLRGEIDAAIRDRNMQAVVSGERTINSLEEAMSTMTRATNMAHAVAIAAFISPRLVLTEAELEPGNPDVWLVSDLAQDELIEFLRWMQRNRAATVRAQGGAAASAGFPGPGLGRTEGSAASNPVQQTTG